MKTQIRKNVFETNSSSIHSLTLSQNLSNYEELTYQKGYLIIGKYGDTEFDRSGIYNDSNSKLNYVILALSSTIYYNKFIEALEKSLPNDIVVMDCLYSDYDCDENTKDIRYYGTISAGEQELIISNFGDDMQKYLDFIFYTENKLVITYE